MGKILVNRLDLHVVGAIPGHPLMKSMLESLVLHQSELNVLKATGNVRFTSLFYEVKHFCGEGIKILPREHYNPIDWGNAQMRQQCFSENCSELFNNSMGIHHHARSWFGIKSYRLHCPAKSASGNESDAGDGEYCS